mgnify:CR=1 FL=1
MTVWVVAGVGLFGGLGALTRFVQDTLVKAHVSSGFPWGTVSINVIGSFLLGLITGLAMFAGEAEQWKIVVGSGFCAGYTTFSTAMFDAATLARAGRWRAAAVDVIGTLVLSVGAAALGIWVAAL